MIALVAIARFLRDFLPPTFLGNATGGLALVAAGAPAEFVEHGPAKNQPACGKRQILEGAG